MSTITKSEEDLRSAYEFVAIEIGALRRVGTGSGTGFGGASSPILWAAS